MHAHTTSLHEKGINYKEGRALLSWVQTEEWCTPAPRLPPFTSCASNSLFSGHSVGILALFTEGRFVVLDLPGEMALVSTSVLLRGKGDGSWVLPCGMQRASFYTHGFSHLQL